MGDVTRKCAGYLIISEWTCAVLTHLTLTDFDDWQDLVAAARILDLAATENGFDDAEDRKTAALLVACAFGMSGAAVSSGAVIRSHDLLSLDLSPGELTALAISCPAMTREIVPKLPGRIELQKLRRTHYKLPGKW